MLRGGFMLYVYLSKRKNKVEQCQINGMGASRAYCKGEVKAATRPTVHRIDVTRGKPSKMDANRFPYRPRMFILIRLHNYSQSDLHFPALASVIFCNLITYDSESQSVKAAFHSLHISILSRRSLGLTNTELSNATSKPKKTWKL